jgi:hypothetical protein
LSATYDGSRYACSGPTDCPGGARCGADGYCPAPADMPDASAPIADAGSDPPDGPQPTVDADLSPDATPPTVTSFGERPTSDVTGVTRDTRLDRDFPTDNFGGDVELAVGHRDTPPSDQTGLLRFELSSLPPGRVVLAASLELWTRGNYTLGGDAHLYPVLESWFEGNQVGVAGVANWTERRAGITWSGQGGFSPSSGSAPVGQFTPRDAATAYTIALPSALVQAWIDNPAMNNGLLITMDSQDGDFTLEASESTNAVRRPQLTVTTAP